MAGARVPNRRDVLLVLVLTAFVLATTTASGLHQPGVRQLDALGYGWLVVGALPLLVRRRFPLVVFGLCAIAVFSYYASDYPGGPAVFFPAAALFMLTMARGALVAGIAGAVAIAGLYAAYLISGGDWLPDVRAAGFVAGVAAVVGIATAVRYRVAAGKARREQETEHQQRLAEQERLRIAREVHDVVAHSLAMINVQAGVAAHVADRRPEQAREALLNIKDASASALGDLRATLAVLRGTRERAPVPSLRQLSELIAHAEAAGLAVRVHGKPGELPAPVDGAAYRIVQESLTNVVRHANRAGTVDIEFRRQDAAFELSVRDDGTGAGEPRTGNGLRGMRERAEALGGSLHAGVPDGAGFEVHAVLPLEGDTS